jgi:hypothetical protein
MKAPSALVREILIVSLALALAACTPAASTAIV